MKKILCTLLIPTVLAACDRIDYDGMDPVTYHETLYPKVNTVEQNAVYQSFYFADGSDTLSTESYKALDAFLERAHPNAVRHLTISLGLRDAARELHVTRLLRSRGFKKSIMEYTTDQNASMDEVVIYMDYAFVVTPRCPDWRKSSTTNYSNMLHSNSYCATETNLGRQIANPMELKQSGAHRIAPNAHGDSMAIQRYRAGEVEVSAPIATTTTQ